MAFFFDSALHRTLYTRWPRWNQKLFQKYMARKYPGEDGISRKIFQEFISANPQVEKILCVRISFQNPSTNEFAGPHILVVNFAHSNWYLDLCISCSAPEVVTLKGVRIQKLAFEELCREGFNFYVNSRLNRQNFEVPFKNRTDIPLRVQQWWSSTLDHLLRETVQNLVEQCLENKLCAYLNSSQFEIDFVGHCRVLLSEEMVIRNLGGDLEVLDQFLGSPDDIAEYLVDCLCVPMRYVLVSSRGALKKFVAALTRRRAKKLKDASLTEQDFRKFFVGLLYPVVGAHSDLSNSLRVLIAASRRVPDFKSEFARFYAKHVAPVERRLGKVEALQEALDFQKSMDRIEESYYSNGREIKPRDFKKIMESAQALTPNFEPDEYTNRGTPNGSLVIGDSVFRRKDLSLHYSGQNGQIYLAFPQNEHFGLLCPMTGQIVMRDKEHVPFREVYDPYRNISLIKLM
jgi:hypothetical protein